MVEWTAEKLETAKEVLRKSLTVKGACKKLSQAFDSEVSTDALGKAFKRNELDPPSDHLLCDTYKIEWRKGVYDFTYNRERHSASFGWVEEWFLMYSDTGPGEGKTKYEVVLECHRRGLDWVTEDFLDWFFRQTNFAKSRYPAAPHQEFTSDEQVAQSMAKLSSVRRHRKLVDRSTDQLKDEIESLRTEVEEYQRLWDFDKCQATFPLIKVKSKQFNTGGSRYLIAAINDDHAGKKIEERPVGITHNIFNREVYYNRHQYIQHLLKQAIEIHQPDGVILFNLGDSFEALLENIRNGMHRDMYGKPFENYKDAVWASTSFGKAVREVTDVPCEFYFIPGNHDRLEADKKSRTEFIMGQIFTERIQNELKSDRVDVQFGGGVASVMLPNGLNVIAHHGHLKELKPKDKDWKNFVDIHGYRDAQRYLTLQAHFHSYMRKNFLRGTHVTLSSIVGSDDYGTDQVHVGNLPMFTMFLSTGNEEQTIGPYNLQVA